MAPSCPDDRQRHRPGAHRDPREGVTPRRPVRRRIPAVQPCSSVSPDQVDLWVPEYRNCATSARLADIPANPAALSESRKASTGDDRCTVEHAAAIRADTYPFIARPLPRSAPNGTCPEGATLLLDGFLRRAG